MKIILCYPPQRKYTGYGQDTRWLPLGIASIGAYLKSKNSELDVVLLDLFKYSEEEALLEILRNLEKNSLNIVGFTLMTEQRFSVFNLYRELKYNESLMEFKTIIKTVVGGPHAFIMANQIADNYSYVDHIIKGEGEIAFYNLVENYNNNIEVDRIIQAENCKNLEDLPHAIDGFKLFKTDTQVDEAPIIFGRGCTDYCTFCSTTAFWKGYRTRKASNVFDEMLKWYTKYNCTYFKFHDDAATADIENLKDLCRLIIKFEYNKIWQFEMTARADQFDNELIELLKLAGCKQVAVGIESGNRKLRESMNKKLNIDVSKQNIKTLKENGINVHLLFIIGYVGETDNTIQETIDFIREARPNSYSAQSLMIFPGTKVYRDLVNLSWINDNYWLQDLPQPYYTREVSFRKLQEWSSDVLQATRKKTIMICAPVRQDERIFELYLEALRMQKIDTEYYNVIKCFILHNSENLKKYIKEEYNEVALIRNSNNEYKKDEHTHRWNGNNFEDVVKIKNELIKIAIENNVDYTFWVDSDLILHENTLDTLLKTNKDIVSEIFWTKWGKDTEPLPNCWNLDQYSFIEKPEKYKKPGLYKVGMTGACTLIKQKVLNGGVNWSPISNISFSYWEDRAFCIKANILGFEIWTDTHYPANHLYRESELIKYLDKLKNNDLKKVDIYDVNKYSNINESESKFYDNIYDLSVEELECVVDSFNEDK